MLTARHIKAYAIAIPIVAVAVWTKLYFVLPIVAVVVWFYLCRKEWFSIVRWLANLPAQIKTIALWISSIVTAIIITAYVVIFFVDLGWYHVAGHGEHLCIINKTEYGAAQNADEAEKYYRTSGIGDIRRGDFALVEFQPTDKADGAVCVSQIVGMPGEKVEIRCGAAWADGQMVDTDDDITSIYNITYHTEHRILAQMEEHTHTTLADSSRCVTLPVVEREKRWAYYTWCSVGNNMPDPRLYPYTATTHWNGLNYGPIWLPRKGDTMKLTPYNVKIYAPMVKAYEGKSLSYTDGKAYIDGREAKEYTFALNYYFFANQDRTQCTDSRLWGPVGESRVVGHAIIQF